MSVQLDLFEKNDDESLKKRQYQENMKIISEGKHLRGLKGKKSFEAHIKKWGELFKEDKDM